MECLVTSGQVGYLLLLLVSTRTSKESLHKSFASSVARVLKFSRLSQHGLRSIAMECLLFGTMSRPCLDHVGAIFGLALLLNHLVVTLLT